MSSTAAPYGLKPVKRADGLPYSGAVTHYLIDPAGEATNLFYGQVVTIGTDGYIALAGGDGSDATTNNLGGSSIGAIGVFVGCEYVNSSGQRVQAQYYPSGTANGGAISAYVVDDPNVLFQAQLDAAGAQSILGGNTDFVAVQSTSTGNTSTGNSTSALDATVGSATKAFKVVGFVEKDGSEIGDAFTDVLVKFNPGYHMMTMDLGV